jgi:hypothetical protein
MPGLTMRRINPADAQTKSHLWGALLALRFIGGGQFLTELPGGLYGRPSPVAPGCSMEENRVFSHEPATAASPEIPRTRSSRPMLKYFPFLTCCSPRSPPSLPEYREGSPGKGVGGLGPTERHHDQRDPPSGHLNTNRRLPVTGLPLYTNASSCYNTTG